MRVKTLLVISVLIVPIVFAVIFTRPLTEPRIDRQTISLQARNPVVALTPPTSISKNVSSTNTVTDDFDSALALTLLSEISLNENGLPVVDSALKKQLDYAVQLIGRDRTPAELDKLGELITQAFKPETAKAITHMLFQYYAYKSAEEDVSRAAYSAGSVDATQNIKTISNLRESYLGHDFSEQLFGEENIYQSYVAELTDRLSASDLSEDMRSNITAEVRKKYYPNSNETDL